MPHLENFFALSEAMDILLKIFVILVDNNRYDLPVFFKIPLDIWYIRDIVGNWWKFCTPIFFFFLNIQITCQFFTWNHETCANMLSKHTQSPKYFSKNQFIKLILQFKHSCHTYFYIFSQFFSLCIFEFYRKLYKQ